MDPRNVHSHSAFDDSPDVTLIHLGRTPGQVSTNSVTAKQTMFIFQNKSRSIMTAGERTFENIRTRQEEIFLPLPSS